MTAKARAEEAKATETEQAGENDPRPTGTNSRQDAEIAELRGQIAALSAILEKQAAVAAPVAAARNFGVRGEVPADITRKAVADAQTEPTTYVALEDGTDFKQGYIKAGTVFTTTQPRGKWMQPVGEDEE